MARRLQAMGVPGYQNGFDISLMEARLDQPLKRKSPTVYFVNSMSDLFHDEIPDSFIDRIFNVIKVTPHHTYQILTKRAERLPCYFRGKPVPENIWLGVSVEDKEYGLPRIDYLRKVDAKIRFLSVEPLLEDIGQVDFSGIHWVIVGGESGPNARPMKQEWVQSIRQQCKESDVSFFFKQWGTWGSDGVKRNKHVNGRLLNGHKYDQYPEVSLSAI